MNSLATLFTVSSLSFTSLLTPTYSGLVLVLVGFQFSFTPEDLTSTFHLDPHLPSTSLFFISHFFSFPTYPTHQRWWFQSSLGSLDYFIHFRHLTIADIVTMDSGWLATSRWISHLDIGLMGYSNPPKARKKREFLIAELAARGNRFANSISQKLRRREALTRLERVYVERKPRGTESTPTYFGRDKNRAHDFLGQDQRRAFAGKNGKPVLWS